MRGKVHLIRRKLFVKRITPAYAGKSSKSVQNYLMLKDHPRLCGEKDDVEVYEW